MLSITNALKDEKYMIIAFIGVIIAYALEHTLISSGQSIGLISSIILIGAIVLASLRVAHHAEVLAEHAGELKGTLILTMSAVLVEVVILSIMMSHNHSPTLARDTIYAAVMLDINGILGLAALLGGFKHSEQKFNHDSAKSYLSMIMVAIGLSMIVPIFIPDEKWKIYSVFSIITMTVLYCFFLKLQTGAHSYFFSYNYPEKKKKKHEEPEGSFKQSASLLIVGIIIIGMLAEVMSKTFDVGFSSFGFPPMVVALVVAGISASPEIMTALRAALANRMQPVVNIALGASLSTVILTIPVIEAIALFQGSEIEMGLTNAQLVMVGLTMLVTMMNVHDGESDAIEGLTHLALFAGFIMLAVIGM